MSDDTKPTLAERVAIAIDDDWDAYSQDIPSLLSEQQREIDRLNSPVVLSEWQQLVAERDALRAEVARLTSAVRWALGYDEGGFDFVEFVTEECSRYAWRSELRRRAAIDAARKEG